MASSNQFDDSQWILINDIALTQSVINIGSDAGNDLVLYGKGVAAFAAMLLKQAERWLLAPMSEFAVLVDGVYPAKSGVLLSGQENISVGKYNLRLGSTQTGAHLYVYQENDSSAVPTQETDDNSDGKLIVVTLEEPFVQVAVEQTAEFHFELLNAGPLVAGFHIRVQGVPPEWVSIVPNVINLNEGQRANVLLQITAPRNAESLAGDYNLSIGVHSPNYPQQKTVTPAVMRLDPFYDFLVTGLTPRQQTVSYAGKRRAQTTLSVVNYSNISTTFEVTTQDDENKVTFEYPMVGESFLSRQAPLSVGAGESAALPIQVCPQRIPFISFGSKTRSFTTNVQIPDQLIPAQMTTGVVKIKPFLNWWAILLILLLIFGSILYAFQPRIYSFEVAQGQNIVNKYETVLMNWDASPFASTMTLSNVEDGNVKWNQSGYSKEMLASTTFTLTAENFFSRLIGWEHQKTLTVLVIPPAPQIDLFFSDHTDIFADEPFLLRWATGKNIDRATITSNKVVTPLDEANFSGEGTFTTTGDTLIYLTAENASGIDRRSIFMNFASKQRVRKYIIWVKPAETAMLQKPAAARAMLVPYEQDNILIIPDTLSDSSGSQRSDKAPDVFERVPLTAEPLSVPKDSPEGQNIAGAFSEKLIELVIDPQNPLGYNIINYQPERTLLPGEQIMLEWQVDGVSSVQIDPLSTQALNATGSQFYFPESSTNFTLTIGSSLRKESYMLPVVVAEGEGEPKPPVIDFFDGNPTMLDDQGTTQLGWSVSGDWTRIQLFSSDEANEEMKKEEEEKRKAAEAAGESYDAPKFPVEDGGLIVDYMPATGFLSANLTKTTSYILKAWNGSLSASKTVKVTVNKPDPGLRKLALSITNVLPNQRKYLMGEVVEVFTRFPGLAVEDAYPTGSILISDGTDQCTISLPNNSCFLTFKTKGFKTITARYLGDKAYQATQAVWYPVAADHKIQIEVVDFGWNIASIVPTNNSGYIGNTFNVGQMVDISPAFSGASGMNGTAKFYDGDETSTNYCEIIDPTNSSKCTLVLSKPGTGRQITAVFTPDGSPGGKVLPTATAVINVVKQRIPVNIISPAEGSNYRIDTQISFELEKANLSSFDPQPSAQIHIVDPSTNIALSATVWRANLQFTSSGAKTIQVNYPGDGSVLRTITAPAVSGSAHQSSISFTESDLFDTTNDSVAVTISKIQPSLEITSPRSNTTGLAVGTPITVQVSFAGWSANVLPSNDILVNAYSLDGTSAGSCTISAPFNSGIGTYSCQMTINQGKQVFLSASFPGDNAYLAINSDKVYFLQVLDTGTSGTTTTIGTPAAVGTDHSIGDSVIFSANVIETTSRTTVTAGSVSMNLIDSAGNIYESCSYDLPAYHSCPMTLRYPANVSSGNLIVRAQYHGTSMFSASRSDRTVVIGANPDTRKKDVSLTFVDGTYFDSDTKTLYTKTVLSGGSSYTGIIRFQDSSVTGEFDCQVNGSTTECSHNYSAQNVSYGTHTLTANYDGDSENNSAAASFTYENMKPQQGTFGIELVPFGYSPNGFVSSSGSCGWNNIDNICVVLGNTGTVNVQFTGDVPTSGTVTIYDYGDTYLQTNKKLYGSCSFNLPESSCSMVFENRYDFSGSTEEKHNLVAVFSDGSKTGTDKEFQLTGINGVPDLRLLLQKTTSTQSKKAGVLWGNIEINSSVCYPSSPPDSCGTFSVGDELLIPAEAISLYLVKGTTVDKTSLVVGIGGVSAKLDYSDENFITGGENSCLHDMGQPSGTLCSIVKNKNDVRLRLQNLGGSDTQYLSASFIHTTTDPNARLGGSTFGVSNLPKPIIVSEDYLDSTLTYSPATYGTNCAADYSTFYNDPQPITVGGGFRARLRVNPTVSSRSFTKAFGSSLEVGTVRVELYHGANLQYTSEKIPLRRENDTSIDAVADIDVPLISHNGTNTLRIIYENSSGGVYKVSGWTQNAVEKSINGNPGKLYLYPESALESEIQSNSTRTIWFPDGLPTDSPTSSANQLFKAYVERPGNSACKLHVTTGSAFAAPTSISLNNGSVSHTCNLSSGLYQCNTLTFGAGINFDLSYSLVDTNYSVGSHAIQAKFLLIPTLTVSAPSGPISVNSAAPFTVEMSNYLSGVQPTGLVYVRDVASDDILCRITLAGGAGSCSLKFDTAGNHAVRAHYDSDMNYQFADSNILHVTVQPANVGFSGSFSGSGGTSVGSAQLMLPGARFARIQPLVQDEHMRVLTAGEVFTLRLTSDLALNDETWLSASWPTAFAAENLDMESSDCQNYLDEQTGLLTIPGSAFADENNNTFSCSLVFTQDITVRDDEVLHLSLIQPQMLSFIMEPFDWPLFAGLPQPVASVIPDAPTTAGEPTALPTLAVEKLALDHLITLSNDRGPLCTSVNPVCANFVNDDIYTFSDRLPFIMQTDFSSLQDATEIGMMVVQWPAEWANAIRHAEQQGYVGENACLIDEQGLMRYNYSYDASADNYVFSCRFTMDGAITTAASLSAELDSTRYRAKMVTLPLPEKLIRRKLTLVPSLLLQVDPISGGAQEEVINAGMIQRLYRTDPTAQLTLYTLRAEVHDIPSGRTPQSDERIRVNWGMLDVLNANAALPPCLTADGSGSYTLGTLTAQADGNWAAECELRFPAAIVVTTQNTSALTMQLVSDAYEQQISVNVSPQPFETEQLQLNLTLPTQAIRLNKAYQIRASLRDASGGLSAYARALIRMAGGVRSTIQWEHAALLDCGGVIQLDVDGNGRCNFSFAAQTDQASTMSFALNLPDGGDLYNVTISPQNTYDLPAITPMQAQIKAEILHGDEVIQLPADVAANFNVLDDYSLRVKMSFTAGYEDGAEGLTLAENGMVSDWGAPLMLTWQAMNTAYMEGTCMSPSGAVSLPFYQTAANEFSASCNFRFNTGGIALTGYDQLNLILDLPGIEESFEQSNPIQMPGGIQLLQPSISIIGPYLSASADKQTMTEVFVGSELRADVQFSNGNAAWFNPQLLTLSLISDGVETPLSCVPEDSGLTACVLPTQCTDSILSDQPQLCSADFTLRAYYAGDAVHQSAQSSDVYYHIKRDRLDFFTPTDVWNFGEDDLQKVVQSAEDGSWQVTAIQSGAYRLDTYLVRETRSKSSGITPHVYDLYVNFTPENGSYPQSQDFRLELSYDRVSGDTHETQQILILPESDSANGTLHFKLDFGSQTILEDGRTQREALAEAVLVNGLRLIYPGSPTIAAASMNYQQENLPFPLPLVTQAEMDFNIDNTRMIFGGVIGAESVRFPMNIYCSREMIPLNCYNYEPAAKLIELHTQYLLDLATAQAEGLEEPTEPGLGADGCWGQFQTDMSADPFIYSDQPGGGRCFLLGVDNSNTYDQLWISYN